MRQTCGTTSQRSRRSRPGLAALPAAWPIIEVGDGNLNLVFIVKGATGGVAVKQALPYVRLVGESWPLPLSRSHYEYLALTHQARLAPGLVPAVLHHNEGLALVVMELIEPHVIMRKGLIAGALLSAFRRRHHDLYGAHAVFLVRPRASCRREEGGDRGVRRQPCALQDHRGSDLHRSLSRGRAEPLDAAVARRDRRRVPRGPRSARRDFAAQAEIPERAGSADPWRPPHRLDHGDGRLDGRDRSRIRVLRTDGLRYRRRHRQSPDGLSGLRRPREVAGRTAGVRGLDAGDDRKRLDGVFPQVPRTLADGSVTATPIR